VLGKSLVEGEGTFTQIQSQNLGDPSRCDSACFSGGDTI